MVPTADRSLRGGVPFRIDVHPERDCVRVVPVGELDVGTAQALETTLRELREADFARIVLDLREVGFLESAGLRVIVVATRLARRDGQDLALISGPPAVQRVIEMCGMIEQLHFDS
ncbi:MAG: STAS domain-containing protein [Thermoleophilia bacterium]